MRNRLSSRCHLRSRAHSAALTAIPVAVILVGCSDAPVAPADVAAVHSVGVAATADVVVTSSAELIAALVPANADRRIRVQQGWYEITQPLAVPDGATLEGDGVMLFDASGLPTGFDAGTRTTIAMTANVPGDVLTLGNGATLRGIAIEDRAGRAGNAVAVVSRAPGDEVRATIQQVEIVNHGTHGVVPSGPRGCGIAVLTLNPNLGNDPPPHAGASTTAKVTQSLIRASATGNNCGVFAFNFAPLASISVSLARSVIGGGLYANGGVSRSDAVHDSRVSIRSQRNLYRDDSADPCVSRALGWNVQAASGPPAPLVVPATERNRLSIHSLDDRIEGFVTAVHATGGKRFFASPTAGAVNDNVFDLELIGTSISTPSCGGTDLHLAGAWAANAGLAPGDGNVLRALIRGVTGSGPRANVFEDVAGPVGRLASELRGTGNRLEIIGNAQAFSRTNTAIEPQPRAEYFTAGR